MKILNISKGIYNMPSEKKKTLLNVKYASLKKKEFKTT
jgi:hypothetical protein